MFPWMRTGYGQHTSRYDSRPFAKTWSNVTYKPGKSTYNYTYNSKRPYQSLKFNAFTSPRNISVQDYSYTKEVPRSYTPLITSQSEYKSSGTSYSYSPGLSSDFTVSKVGRLEDKEELQVLNNRLSEYISRVRQLWEQRGQIDSSAFLKSTRILEEEIQNLKGMYECELENLRRKLQDNVNERNSLQTKYGDCHHSVKDLEKRLAQEIDKNREMVANVTNLQETISYLEQEIAKLRSIPQPVDESPALRKQVSELIRERDDFKARWHQEQKSRKDVEERFAAYSKKAEFDADVLRQQINDLKQRLEATTSTILALETRIRELSKTDTNIPQLLSQVRRAAEEELRKHETDIEQKYSKNINSLKQRMDNDASVIGRLEQEKTQILGSVGDLKARISDLESQVSALAQHKQSLQDLIAQERATASAQIREMDRRFKELQDDFFAKINDARFSKDSFIPLKAEIEAMKLLLTEEERRLSAPINYSTVLKETYIPATTTVTHSYGTGGSGKIKEYTAYRPSGVSNYQTKQYYTRYSRR